MEHIQQNVPGLKPRNLGVLKGVRLTTAIVNNQRTGGQELLLGVQDHAGKETAVPMLRDDAIAFAEHLLTMAKGMPQASE